VAEVTARQCDDEDDGIAHQVIDGWAYAKAQVAAACNLGSYAANKQMRIAQALRDRLPRTAALFAAGALSMTVIDAITWRTHLVADDEALALIDTAIAGEAHEYGALSEKGLENAVDLWVQKFDAYAVLRSKAAAKNLYVEFDDRDDPAGVASFWGRLRVTDKIVLSTRLNDLAATVCANDPRPIGELRAAALGALGVVGPGLERLTCECGDAECPGSGKDPRATPVSIYALAEQITQTTPPRPAQSRPAPSTDDLEPELFEDADSDGDAEHAAPSPEPMPTNSAATFGTGVLLDGAVIPAALLDALAATGATVRPLTDVCDLQAESRHDPSAKLTAFVRMRAQTCTFPGCHKPAHRCDLDHLVPWPAGATHPGNLHPLCREHHLVKTFSGWTPKLKPDGAVQWTSPTGHRYTQKPGAAILFPHWNIHTRIPPARPVATADGAKRDAMMPTRHRTRAQDREQRINAERARNATELALQRIREQVALEDRIRTARARQDGAPDNNYFTDTVTYTDNDPPPF
ncbi:MAG: DUF222 domain-containing protein, partial [Mycobacterium sp.]